MSSWRIKGSRSNCVSLVSSGLSWEIKTCIYTSDGYPFISRKRILIHISRGLDYILFLSVFRISKTFLTSYKKCIMKINIESSPPEIWIRICFLEMNGSPSLIPCNLNTGVPLSTTFICFFSVLRKEICFELFYDTFCNYLFMHEKIFICDFVMCNFVLCNDTLGRLYIVQLHCTGIIYISNIWRVRLKKHTCLDLN